MPNKLFLAFFLALFPFCPLMAQEKIPAAEKPLVDEKELCRGREGCRLMWAKPAGQDEKNRDMVVAEVIIPSPPEWKCRRPPNDHNGEFVQNVRQEIWLTLKGGLLSDHTKLFDFCNDGYGAADVGEDRIAIEDGALTHRAFGGSALRWMNGQRIALPKAEITHSYACSFHSLFGGNDYRMYDYENGAFRIGWSEEVRGEGQVPSRDDFINCDAPTLDKAGARHEALLFKQIHSFLGLRLEEVKELGSCATTLSTQDGPHKGYLIYGQDDGTAAEVKALRINDDQLWVSVLDKDRRFTASKDWSHDDRLEIWWVEERTPRSPASTPRRALRQFAVRMADLMVFPGYGYNETKKKLPFVERRSGQGLSFIIRWPQEQFPSQSGLTLAYAHGDGKATAAMWATSALKYGDSSTLSPVLPLQQQSSDPMQSCFLDKDGALQLVPPAFERPSSP